MNHRFPIGLMVLVAIPGIAIPGRAAPGPWVPTGGPAGGIVENVTTEGDMALASTRSSVFRSTDRGETWTADVSGIPEGVVIEALGTNGSVGLAGTRASGLFRSADGGRRWVSVPELPSTIGAIHFEDAAVHVLAHSDFTSSIFRSSDTFD